MIELCFWLFLVNAVRARQDWFRSSYFRTWTIGSVVAVSYMPLITIFTRSDPLKVSCPCYELQQYLSSNTFRNISLSRAKLLLTWQGASAAYLSRYGSCLSCEYLSTIRLVILPYWMFPQLDLPILHRHHGTSHTRIYYIAKLIRYLISH